MPFKTTIGLEIHVQLKTKSKMFCGCSNMSENENGKEPNTRVCPVCMGFPGTLPVANIEAIKKTIMTGLALNCEIPNESKFDRKHYFYPDLPKNFQISQYDEPFARLGELQILDPDSSKSKKIGINRVHLEEDAGKLVHPEGAEYSLVDMNRCGTPLMEIVTEPDIDSPELAKKFLKELRLIVRYLDVSNADMERGQLRCDANISIQRKSEIRNPKSETNSKSKKPNSKTVTSPIIEIKNMNSFRAVERALKYEEERLREDFDDEIGDMNKKTRAWIEKQGVTKPMRVKEEASDYRYFPEPDIPPVLIDKKIKDEHGIMIHLIDIKRRMPELPQAKRERYKLLGLKEKAIESLVNKIGYSNYFDEVVEAGGEPQKVYDYMVNEKLGTKIKIKHMVEAFKLLNSGEISNKILKSILPEMIESGKSAKELIGEKGLKQVSNAEDLKNIIKEVIKENPKPVSDYKGGKEQTFGFLVGQVMQKTKGQANPALTNKLLRDMLK